MRSSIKKVVVAATTLSLLAGVGASVALADRPDQTPTTFCHKPGTPAEQTMTLPRVAYENGHTGHPNHDDPLGPCSNTPPPPPPPPPGGGGDPSHCEDVLEHLTGILPDDVLAILDLAAVASVDDLVLALAHLEVVAGIDLDAILVEITDGVCDLLDLVLHIKHKVLGVAFFATGGVLHLAGHVTHKALHLVGDVVDHSTGGAIAGVFVGLDAAVFNILDIDASALAVVGLL